jgi:hypothetical protein
MLCGPIPTSRPTTSWSPSNAGASGLCWTERWPDLRECSSSGVKGPDGLGAKLDRGRLGCDATSQRPIPRGDRTGRLIWTPELVAYPTADGKIIDCWGDLHSTVREG